ncbi:MAG: hypothetical protein ACI9DM_000224 [Cyclobacteriaceae bacterium]|jgi:hypothetical protein
MILIFKTTGEPLKPVNTLKEASVVTGCDMGNISNVLKGKIDQSKGYTFMRSDGNLSKMLVGTFVDDYFQIRSNSLKDYISKKIEGEYA